MWSNRVGASRNVLRITKVSDSAELTSLRVEGQVVSHWIAELEHEIKRSLGGERQVVLDFSHVNFVSLDGAKMLKSLDDKNVAIINCSGMIKALLGVDDRADSARQDWRTNP